MCRAKRGDAAEKLIEASFFRSASTLLNSVDVPRILRRDVEIDVALAVLRKTVDVAGSSKPSPLLVRTLACLKEDVDVASMAEILLECPSNDIWPHLIAEFPRLLPCLVLLNYGETEFLSRLRSACERWPRLGALVEEFAGTISDETVRGRIFGNLLEDLERQRRVREEVDDIDFDEIFES